MSHSSSSFMIAGFDSEANEPSLSVQLGLPETTALAVYHKHTVTVTTKTRISINHLTIMI